MHWLTRQRIGLLRRPLTSWFAWHFAVDMSEAAPSDPHAYETFNAFFTRPLRPGARPMPADPTAIACPADGRISQIGSLAGDLLIQAKGSHFDCASLLGGRDDLGRRFRDGLFATIYLAPYNYHRVHMPVAGVLEEMIYIPGRLFSVNAATTRSVPRLFARNERVVCMFATGLGPMAVVLVGALFVGSIETVWTGEITPPHGGQLHAWDYPRNTAPRPERGAEIGRFNMGSTVVLLLPAASARWRERLDPGTTVEVGMTLGEAVSGSAS